MLHDDNNDELLLQDGSSSSYSTDVPIVNKKFSPAIFASSTNVPPIGGDNLALDMNATVNPKIEQYRAMTVPVRQLRPEGLITEFSKSHLPNVSSSTLAR